MRILYWHDKMSHVFSYLYLYVKYNSERTSKIDKKEETSKSQNLSFDHFVFKYLR
jgi:hypothetical protein